ncbi:hypothetical protein HDU91_001089 [Kappamyces sp. JEL0680]|nr:hypothetical protein HDU91_001089 [Kappamyces sp. JEL0680]
MYHLDNTAICRLSQASKAMNTICKDHVLWVHRMSRDWHDYAVKTKREQYLKAFKMAMTYHHSYRQSRERLGPAASQPSSSPGYNFYRQRHLTYARFTGPKKSRLDRHSVCGILSDEADAALGLVWKAAMMPLKLLGVLTYPIYWTCQRRNQALQSSPSSCLRLFVVDLTRLAERLTSFSQMHVFGTTNCFCLLLWTLDEIARCLARFAVEVVTLALASSGTGREEPGRELDQVAPDAGSGRLSFHLQLIILPWSIINGRYLFSATAYSLLECWWFKQYPVSITILSQILWTPVICSVEELSYDFASQAIGARNSVVFWVQQFLKIFTMSLQCVIGVCIYSFLILLSIGRNQMLM